MSQTSVVRGTPTERFILDVSTWWTKADVKFKDGAERGLSPLIGLDLN